MERKGKGSKSIHWTLAQQTEGFIPNSMTEMLYALVLALSYFFLFYLFGLELLLVGTGGAN